MKEIEKLTDGFRRFRAHYFEQDHELYRRLAHHGQKPRVMVISCCDSRADPAIVTDCDPGDLFVVRNVANLVPPYETTGHYHGTSAALEFAVRVLQVRHIIVLGHARCGGIRALLEGTNGNDGLGQFIAPWMEIAAQARDEARQCAAADSPEKLAEACEQAAIRISLRNLLTFPWIRTLVESDKLSIHGWFFDLSHGALTRLDHETGRFEPLD
jgi:carbonic anhydrase